MFGEVFKNAGVNLLVEQIISLLDLLEFHKFSGSEESMVLPLLSIHPAAVELD